MTTRLRAATRRLRRAEARDHVEQESVCVDRRRQWRNARNVWRSAAIRSGIYAAGAPLRAMRRRKPVA